MVRRQLLVLALAAASGGCRESMARVIPQAHLTADMDICHQGILPVGDTIRFWARMTIRNDLGGISGPLDNYTLYTTDDNPGAFRWSLSYPARRTGGPQYDRIGRAELTSSGLLIGRDTGVVYVDVASAGKRAGGVEIRIVPRLTRLSVTPADTLVIVGDTLLLRADVASEGPLRLYHDFAWVYSMAGSERFFERVVQDPDLPQEARRPRLLELPIVATRAGTAVVHACIGPRADSAVIRISGAQRSVDRNVPPAVRLLPMDTTVYVGDAFTGSVRIVNAALGNGPYRWTIALGDGSTPHSDSAQVAGPPGPFGLKREAFIGHRYFAPGRYPVHLVVTDADGRTTEVTSHYTAVIREFRAVALPPAGGSAVSLSDGNASVEIALLADTARNLWPAHVAGAKVVTRMAGVPPLIFGQTVFDPEPDGRRRYQRDVNADGQMDDVFVLDKTELIRNGDLRVGRNRLVITGALPQKAVQRGRDGRELEHWPPVRAVAEFDVLP